MQVFVACGLGISLANGAESMNFVSVLTMVGVLCCLLTTFQFFFQEDTSFYIPWYEIATSKHVWAISFAHFTNNWGFYTLLTSLPLFLNDVLRFNLLSVRDVMAYFTETTYFPPATK